MLLNIFIILFRTFINNHLLRTSFVDIDTSYDYKNKQKFVETIANIK